MILKGSYKVEALLRMVCKHVSPDGAIPTTFAPDGRETYFGSGYWRCSQAVDADDKVIGLRLINPSRTAAEISAVEQGVAILCLLDYRE